MAMTRSSPAKKVVRKAVAVKVTKSPRRKNLLWNDTYTQLIGFWKNEGRPHCSTMLGKWCAQQQAYFQANKPLLSQDHID
jgi:hypothetical protein